LFLQPLETNLTPFICPLCGDTGFERLLTISGTCVATTVISYRCLTNGHIFFVRKADIDARVAA